MVINEQVSVDSTYLSMVPAMKYTIGKQQMASRKWLSGLWGTHRK